MIEILNDVFVDASNFVWNYVVVGLCVTVGLYCTARLLFIQFRCFPHAVALLRGKYTDSDASTGITTFQALSTTLSGTTGIGNIAGVAVAIKFGGPGAIFWMWVMALIGMVLKYMEATLGSLYRTDVGGRYGMVGGPMYYITQGLSERWRSVAVFYAICAAIACLGAWNMFQSNQAAAILQDQLQVPTWVTGLVLCISVGLVLIGGIKRIGLVAERLVPTMCVIYVSTVTVICLLNLERMPAVFALIIDSAFDFESAGGGVIGTVILTGIRRAVFSNEAGTGSAAIAHAAADTSHPVRQGVVASLGPFIDTIVVCAATAFVILLSGFYGTESYQNNSAAQISFERKGAVVGNEDNWQIIAQGIPEDDGSLQRFTHESSVLSYRGKADTTSQSPAINLYSLLKANPNATSATTGIRFSIWSDTPLVEVHVHADKGPRDLSLQLFPVESNRLTPELEGRKILKQWGSRVIRPSEDVWLKLLAQPQSEGAALRFVVEGAGTVYIDRVELVSEADGIVLSTAAFSAFFGVFGDVFIPIAALFFAYTTILAGNYYGQIACHFLNVKLIHPYLWLYIGATFVGSTIDLQLVINFSDLSLGLMAIPNLIAMALLTPMVVSESKAYFSALRAGEMPKKPPQDSL